MRPWLQTSITMLIHLPSEVHPAKIRRALRKFNFFPIDNFSNVVQEFVLEEPAESLAIAAGATGIFATQPAAPVMVKMGNQTTPLKFQTPNNSPTFKTSPQGSLLVIGQTTQFIEPNSGL